MNKAYKYRIYPNKTQEQQLARTFGCCRFVYNQILALQETNYKNNIKHMSKFDMNNYCNHVLKAEYPFLKEVDKFAVTNSICFLETGYQRFFKKQGGYPRFKNKHRSRKSYTTNFTNNNIEVLEREIKLPKLGKVKAVVHRAAPSGYHLKSATVSQERDGSCYCSVLYEYEAVIMPVAVREIIGLDYKSDGLYVSSDEKVCGSPKYFRKSAKKLAKAQRRLKHMQTHSSNYNKQQQKIARIHRHISSQRKDFLHKKSTEIANLYDLVCVENLNMKSMSNKGFGNGKATLDNGYGMFLNMLDYKLADRGRQLIRVGKWYASSQICSCCGEVNKMALSDRKYQCPCGNRMDRDLNAAINIKNEGYRLYREIVA